MHQPQRQLAVVPGRGNALLGLNSMERWRMLQEQAEIIAKSGLAPARVSTPAAIMTIGLVAQELDLPLMYALRNVHIIEGKPSLSAAAQHGLVLRTHGDDALVVDDKHSTDQQAIVWYRRREWPEPRRVTFTIAEAQQAGLLHKDNWKKYPAAMLKARAIGIAATIGFPDVLAGIYQPDELGLDTDAEGTPLIDKRRGGPIGEIATVSGTGMQAVWDGGRWIQNHPDGPRDVSQLIDHAADVRFSPPETMQRPIYAFTDGVDAEGRRVSGFVEIEAEEPPFPDEDEETIVPAVGNTPRQNAAYPPKVMAANRLLSREPATVQQRLQQVDGVEQVITSDGEVLGPPASEAQQKLAKRLVFQEWNGDFKTFDAMTSFCFGSDLYALTGPQVGAIIEYMKAQSTRWVHPDQLGLGIAEGDARELTEAEAQELEASQQAAQDASPMRQQVTERRAADLENLRTLLPRAKSWSQLQALARSIKQWGYGKDEEFRALWGERVKEQIAAGVVAPSALELPGL